MKEPYILFVIRLVLSLATSDLCIGVLTGPYTIFYVNNIGWAWTEFPCKLFTTLDVTFRSASIYGFLAISFDRLYAVYHPIG